MGIPRSVCVPHPTLANCVGKKGLRRHSMPWFSGSNMALLCLTTLFVFFYRHAVKGRTLQLPESCRRSLATVASAQSQFLVTTLSVCLACAGAWWMQSNHSVMSQNPLFIHGMPSLQHMQTMEKMRKLLPRITNERINSGQMKSHY